VFLGYSNIHKGFKCLEVNIGRIYISRDIVFDENIFSFSRLHPNAGARLILEILLLSPALIGPKSLSKSVNNLEEPMTNSPNPVNQSSAAVGGVWIAFSGDTRNKVDSTRGSAPSPEHGTTSPP
jgi:hypothetical protein